jgi:hypothetical protein
VSRCRAENPQKKWADLFPVDGVSRGRHRGVHFHVALPDFSQRLIFAEDLSPSRLCFRQRFIFLDAHVNLLGDKQSDRSRRDFASWAIVYFGQFF